MQQAVPELPPEYPFVCRDSFKLLRNKRNPCSRCKKSPPQGKIFRRCAGCQAVLYCSRVCQEADRDRHRNECRRDQQLLNADTGHCRHDVDEAGNNAWFETLTKVERSVVLGDFIEYHMQNFMNAVTLLRGSLHPADLNTATQAIIVTLDFSEDKERGPASRLFIKKIALGPRGLLEMCATPRCTNCASLLVLCYRLRDIEKTDTMKLNPLSEEELYKAHTLGMEWVEYLRFAIAIGMVLMVDQDDLSDDAATMGYLQKSGREWKWQPEQAQSFVQLWKRRGPLLRQEPVPEVDMGDFNTHLRRRSEYGAGCTLC